MSHVPRGHADRDVLAGLVRHSATRSTRLRAALDSLYADFNHPESALDPVQIIRRYERTDDREIVAFIAAGLAFGRVASVMASVEAVCRVLGPEPASFVRQFDPVRQGALLAGVVHRWTRGADVVALLWILRRFIDEHGSIEQAFAAGVDPNSADFGPAIEDFSGRARRVDVRLAYGGRLPARPGVLYFFTQPSSGAACKRLNLFLRWMVRKDGVDPGGWTMLESRQLVVPLDTHTIRVGRCLRLTRRASPGWKMAADITAALRALDPDDPVRYDFSLCHLSMMGSCGWHTKRGNRGCPLRSVCRPVRA
jgi:uncharacterized protein (TIGR02757 family)